MTTQRAILVLLVAVVVLVLLGALWGIPVGGESGVVEENR